MCDLNGLLKMLVATLGLFSSVAHAQSPSQSTDTPAVNTGLSVQGYSSTGVMTPNAFTLPSGAIGISYDRQMPGAPDPDGYNIQMGFGLLNNLEMVGRLATNDLNCDMFEVGACPPAIIRDFSGSLKWQLPMPASWSGLPRLAIGATDLGGAATYFRSYYGVVSQRFDDVEVSLGMASAKVDTAPLNGVFGSVYWQAASWLGLSAEAVGGETWMSARLTAPRSYSSWSMQPYFSVTQRISDSTLTEKNWMGVGATMAFDLGLPTLGPRDAAAASSGAAYGGSSKGRSLGVILVVAAPASQLVASLEAAGFYKPMVQDSANGLWVRVNNTSYAWNLLDAAGAALGPVAAAYGTVTKPFVVEVSRRGIVLARLQGTSNCAYQFLTEGTLSCSNGSPLRFVSPAGSSVLTESGAAGASASSASGSSGQGAQGPSDFGAGFFSAQAFRPEVILSPGLITGIGTEAGALDHDIALNANLILPLWKGAYVDINRVVPLGMKSGDFQSGGAFYNSRFIAATDRKLVHQFLRLPMGDTLAKLSYGSLFARPKAQGEGRFASGAIAPITLPASDWHGWQLEAASQFLDGQLRLSLQQGDFNNEEAADGATGLVKNREPSLVSVRVAPAFWPSSHTEIQAGTFWGGDKGYLITQRFWHGDTSFGVFFRKSRIESSEPYTSFAGFQIAVPLTARVNRGQGPLQLQGTNQFQYSVETKVLEKDNRIVQGYGILPRVGESLSVFTNRDRTGVDYLNRSIYRLREGYDIAKQ
jgi:hypothetical protein